MYLPRSIGDFSSSSSCRLWGWGETIGQLPRKAEITIYDPKFCDDNFPQIFCTTFSSINNQACTARQGSPVTCGDKGIIVGLLVNDEYCATIGDRHMLNYLSVSEFREWIQEVSGAEKMKKISLSLLIVVLLVGFNISF